MANTRTKGLGKDFSTLIPDDMLTEALAVGGTSEDQVHQVSLDAIQPDPDQPRKQFNETSLADLATSISEHGIVQPLIVSKTGDSYKIIAGERRWRAAIIAGLTTAPVIIRSYDEQQRLEIALIENIQREELIVLDLAAAYFKLRTQFNLSLDQISERIGKSPSAIGNIIRLLKMPPEAKKAMREGIIIEGHGRQIIALPNVPEQLKLLNLVIANKWNVRQAEQYVIGFKRDQSSKSTLPTNNAMKLTQSESKETIFLSERLKTEVRIKNMAKGGQLIIHFKNDVHLRRLVDKMSERTRAPRNK